MAKTVHREGFTRDAAPAARYRACWILALVVLLAASAAGLHVVQANGANLLDQRGPATVTVASMAGAVLSVPSPPRNLNAVGGDSQVTLTWDPPADNGGLPVLLYRIYRGTSSGGESFLIEVPLILTYIDLLVTNGVTYYYQVTAVNLDGESGYSNEVSATPGPPATVPGPPTGLTAIGGDRFVALAWLAPDDDGGSPITNYRLYRGTSSGGESFYVDVGNVLVYSDGSVANGVTYYYQVSAENAQGEGSLSNEASATPAGTPGAPQGLTATAGDGTVTLAWSAPGSDGGSPIDEYRIYRGTSPGTGSQIATVAGDALTYTDTGLSNGVQYYYRVTAVNGIGEGPFSNEVSATPLAPPTPPGAPQNLRATAGDATVTLEWSAPTNSGGSPISRYNVYQGTTSGGETFRSWVAGDVLTFTDTGLANGKEYFYKVTAVNDAGEGPVSNEASATPQSTDTVPGAPQDLSATPGDGTVTLIWNAPASDGGSPITNYKILRGTAPGDESEVATVADVRTFTDTGRDNGVRYYYQVTAKSAIGDGPPSNEVSATPATTPDPPEDVRALAGDARITIQWSGPGFNGGAPVTNYRIYRGTTSGGTSLYKTVGAVDSYSDEGLTNGVTYYYVVSAVNRVGEGTLSNEVSAQPTAGPTVPNAPRSLVTTSGNGYNILNWQTPIQDGGTPVLNYTVYRGFAADRLTVLVRGGTAHSLWDGGLMNGMTYYYAVSAVNSVGEGPRTEPVSGTPEGTPTGGDTTKPSIVIASPTEGATMPSGTITVSGVASDDVGVMRVEVSTDGMNWAEAAGNPSWTASVNLMEGSRMIYARALDAAGNVAVVSVSVTVGGTGPPGDTGTPVAAGGDRGPAVILMAFLSFTMAGGIAWFVLNRRRRP